MRGILIMAIALMATPAMADRPIMTGDPPWVRNNWITYQTNQARALRAAPPSVLCESGQGYGMLSTNGRCGIPAPRSGQMPPWPQR